MTIRLPEYARIKDKYLIAYFGHANEYLVQLILVRPLIELCFPGLEVHFCFRQEAMYLVGNEARIFSKDKYKQLKSNYAYVRELACNSEVHPVDELMIESKVPYKPVWTKPRTDTGRCLLSRNGNFPTGSLSEFQVEKLKRYAQSKGYEAEEGIIDVDWVIGVESEEMMVAASKGAKVSLVPTGVGTHLVKKLFPQTEILEDAAYITLKTQDQKSK
jgi:hypothetical protein